MRADLHVHSWHSTQSAALRFLRSRDCYSDPVDVYRTARARGMDLVTITDHDSIDGCLELLNRSPDLENFVIGEEVSCRFPDGDIEVHLGVYGMTEALHRELQPLRGNVFDVIACLRAHDVFFTLNHLLHFYRGQAPLASYLRLALEVPALEVRNGAMLPEHNSLIEQYAACHAGPLGIRRRQRRAYAAQDRPHLDRGAGRDDRRAVHDRAARGPRPDRRRAWQRAGDRDRDLRRRGALYGEPRRLWSLRATAASPHRLPRVQRGVVAVSIHPVGGGARAPRRANAARWLKCGASWNRCSRDSAATTTAAIEVRE